jgi:glycosyltransferase involved in cell wall biosynthesis
LRQAGVVDALGESVRNVANKLQLRHSRRVHRAAHAAGAVVVANTSMQEDFRKVIGVNADVLLDVGYRPIDQNTSPHVQSTDGVLRILWSGTLCARKALGILIDALAAMPADFRCEVRVLGQGPYKKRWERLASRRGVAGKLRWLGQLPHAEARRQYEWADVFVFTSLRDTTGTVLAEALAAGLPVVCLDHQGARDVVSADCGLKVAVTNPKDVAQQLAAALMRLANDRELYARLAAGAKVRAREFEWSQLGRKMVAIYERVLGRRLASVTSEAQTTEPRKLHRQPAFSGGISQ